MYKIYADETLIYDSTIEDYKIGKGQVTLETNKAGSFVFSIYKDHFFYDRFVKMKTVIKVLRDGKILFRGRVLNDSVDYYNKKVLTCEGELNFLRDSIVRPFNFTGSPEDFLRRIITDHNDQADEFKRFKIGSVTVVGENVNRYSNLYDSSLNILNDRLLGSGLGGYFYITHGANATEEIPTINYLIDFNRTSSQKIEFGSNLKDYTRTAKADDLATVLIPLGVTTNDVKITIASVNDGKDYLVDPVAVELYGWIVKVEEWEDIKTASVLKSKGEARLKEIINQNITLELSAIDLHLYDRSIESFNVSEYVYVTSAPHNFDSVMLCNKQVIDLMRPDNDRMTLGYTFATFTDITASNNKEISMISVINTTVSKIAENVTKAQTDADTALNQYTNVARELSDISGGMESIASVVVENARNIATNAQNISSNTGAIADMQTTVNTLSDRVEAQGVNIGTALSRIGDLETELATTNSTVNDNLLAPLTEKETSIADMIARIEALEAITGNEV